MMSRYQQKARRVTIVGWVFLALAVASLALGMPDLLGHGYADSPFGLAVAFASLGAAQFVNAGRLRQGLEALNLASVRTIARTADAKQREGAVQWLVCVILTVAGGLAAVILHVIAVQRFGA